MFAFSRIKKPSGIIIASKDFGVQESLERNWSVRPETSKGYLIGLLNYTTTCITHAATRGNADWSTPFSIPTTCKNCNSLADHDQCVKDRKYTVLFSVDCTAAPFELFVGWKQGDDYVGGVFRVTPNCQFGGAICDYD